MSVVDDDAAACRAVAELVQTFGYQVRSYETPEEFLAEVNGDRPGCAVIDLRMPGMTGTELHQKLTEREIVLPVVVLTAYADTPSTVRSLRRGAVSVIDKPYREDELWRAIQEGIERSHELLRRQRHQQAIEQRLRQLGPQDRDVLSLMLAGTKNRSIAKKLGVSLRTVENRRRRVFDVMQADSVALLTRMIVEYEYGVVPMVNPSESWLSLPYERAAG
ncbi:MAG: response regulator transcription factor [Planctomycetales bacterium]|nr:response regulator transcription factor [Planctomycetales bacterium]